MARESATPEAASAALGEFLRCLLEGASALSIPLEIFAAGAGENASE